MVKDRSENAFDTIRIRGKWWIPDGEAEPKKVSGALTFDVGSGGVLDLDDALSDNFRSIPVVHGLGTQGECVTIFNGGTSRLVMNGNSTGLFRRETITFYDMWVGNQLFTCKEEVCFKEYSFGIHNIENWADRHCFFPPRRQKPNRTYVSYKSPKPILLFQDECMTIHLDGFANGPSYSLGQQEASIQHFPRIVIRSKDGVLPYYGPEGTISDREWMIFVLIALLMGTVTWNFGFEGIITPLHITEQDFSEAIAVRHYFQHDWGKVDPVKHPIHFELLFPYETIGKRFPKIASRFSEVFHANENPVNIVYRLQCRKAPFHPSTLPELLFAFEELEKNLLREQNDPIEKDEKSFADTLRKKLKTHCTKTEWNWASRKLTSQGLSFQKRCLLAFEEMRQIYSDLEDGSLSKTLAGYLKDTRNDYAHAVKSTSDDHVLYVYTTYWLAQFMTLMILRASGLPADKIKNVFFRDPGPDRGKTKRFFGFFREKYASVRLK